VIWRYHPLIIQQIGPCVDVPYGWVISYRRFELVCRLHLQGSEPIHGLIVLRWIRYIRSKRREDITQPHDAITQRTWLLNTKTCSQITRASSTLPFPVENAATVQSAWCSESGTFAVAFSLSLSLSLCITCYTSGTFAVAFSLSLSLSLSLCITCYTSGTFAVAFSLSLSLSLCITCYTATRRMAVLSQHYLRETKRAALNGRCREQTRLPSLCLFLSIYLSLSSRERTRAGTHTHTHTNWDKLQAARYGRELSAYLVS